ncbi:hypothetical protein FRC12_007525 [Ceratobasidium sp. 428]|nr:hypothetical protein FRC12_007525 [Ceratobasidium sp. 428]
MFQVEVWGVWLRSDDMLVCFEFCVVECTICSLYMFIYHPLLPQPHPSRFQYKLSRLVDKTTYHFPCLESIPPTINRDHKCLENTRNTRIYTCRLLELEIRNLF